MNYPAEDGTETDFRDITPPDSGKPQTPPLYHVDIELATDKTYQASVDHLRQIAEQMKGQRNGHR